MIISLSGAQAVRHQNRLWVGWLVSTVTLLPHSMQPFALSTFEEIASSELEDERVVEGFASPFRRGRLSHRQPWGNEVDSDDDVSAHREDLVQAARRVTTQAEPRALEEFGQKLLQADVVQGYYADAVLALRAERARVMLDAIQMAR